MKLPNVFQEEAKAKAEAEKAKAEEAKTKAEAEKAKAEEAKTKAEAEKAEKAKKDVSDELQLINTIAPILAGRQIQGRSRQTEERSEI